MKAVFRTIIIFLCSCTLQYCTEDVTSETEFEPQILITGNINAVEKTASINIQRTVPVNSTTPDYINTAEVTLYTKDQNGIETMVTNNFSKSSEGRYQNTETIEPIVGNQYWIEVHIPNEDSFRSIPETLKEIVPINSITVANDLPRVHFNDPEVERNFYYLTVTYFINFNLVDSDELVVSDTLFNGNENTFLEPSVSKIYDVLFVRLHHINYNTFQYLTNILTINDFVNINIDGENPGELFSNPPINIIGNITNTTTNQTALGNFATINYDISIFTKELPTN